MCVMLRWKPRIYQNLSVVHESLYDVAAIELFHLPQSVTTIFQKIYNESVFRHHLTLL